MYEDNKVELIYKCFTKAVKIIYVNNVTQDRLRTETRRRKTQHKDTSFSNIEL